MATYKKRGAKKTQNPKGSQVVESKTEEVFSNLDTGASKLEQWIAAYQRQIFGLIFGNHPSCSWLFGVSKLNSQP